MGEGGYPPVSYCRATAVPWYDYCKYCIHTNIRRNFLYDYEVTPLFPDNILGKILTPYAGEYGNYTTHWSIPAIVSISIGSTCYIFNMTKKFCNHTMCVCVCVDMKMFTFIIRKVSQRDCITWYLYSYSITTYLFKFCSCFFPQQSAFSTQIIIKVSSSNIFRYDPYLLLHISGLIHFYCKKKSICWANNIS